MVFKSFKRSNSGNNSTRKAMITSPLAPERKRIQLLYDYKSQGDLELSFLKGQEFYLINEADENWYNVSDLSQLKLGVVPKSYFKILTPSYSHNGATTTAKRQSLITLHGKVLYDFDAMSNQELQVTKDEYVTICAHSGNDWYIAKPVSRLGGPGLVPVSYVGILDMSRGGGAQLKVFTQQDILQSKLPTVEQWNKERDEYKKSATPINISAYNGNNLNGAATGNLLQANYPNNSYDKGSLNRSETLLSSRTESSLLDIGDIYVIQLIITEKYFTKESDGRGKYWYVIELMFNNGVRRLINRCYEDFFDFQAHLKKLFPRDAGAEDSRILPTIPGPLANVSSTILDQRLHDFNNYLSELLELPMRISRCKFVVSFFDIKYYNDRNIIPEQRKLSVLSSSHLLLLRLQLLQPQQQIHSSSQSLRTVSQTEEKFKFYFNDDIFVLKLSRATTVLELRAVLLKRCAVYNFRIILITEGDSEYEINTDDELLRCFELEPKKRKIRVVAF